MFVLLILFLSLFLISLFFIFYLLAALRKSKKNLWTLTYIDTLTGISNLNKFKIDAESLLKKENRGNHELVRFDIEKFKIINDMFGFEEGDQVLLAIVKIVQDNIEKGELLARVGNDDFILLVKNTDKNEILKDKKKMLKAFSELKILPDSLYKINFSIGIYGIKAEDSNINKMLERVSMAHKSAKLIGSNEVVIFNDEMRDTALRTKEIENTMESALANGDFVVYVQPKFNLNSLEISGAEALIRWKHLTRGIVSPNEFIPIFERNGFVINIDNFVLEKICKYTRMLLDEGIKPVSISVNQSRLHVNNPNYVKEIKSIVKKYEVPPEFIELELTETTMHDNIEILINITKELQDYGFIISIDDFGSGYSSLNMLKDISANVLKIDREFLERSEKNARGKTVLANIIRLAKELNMEVVTEGVETKSQEALLKELHSDMVQGFLYAKPMPIGELKALLKKQ